MAAITLDLMVLRMLKDRDKYERMHRLIPEGTVNAATASMLKNYGLFFKQTDAKRVTVAEFWPFLRTRYPKWTAEDMSFYAQLVKPIDTDNALGVDEQVIANILATDLGNKALSYIEQWQQGEEIDLAAAMRSAVERYDEFVQRRVRTPNVELSWERMAEIEQNDEGFAWRLKALHSHTRNLRGGDFGIIAMRPDRGKTTLVASEISHMAPQALKLFPDRLRPTIWLNNEGPGSRILGRIRTSALGVNLEEFLKLGPTGARKQYTKLMGGYEDLIQVKDIHGWSNAEVEDYLAKLDPALVVWDMIDNIQFTGATMNNGERTDQLLESMYQWARSLMVKLDSVGLATSQISAEGEGVRFPAQSQLKDSRTGKQGACDFIITGGVDNNMPTYRFIGMTKNKLKRQGMASSPNAQVLFDMDRGRFVEAEDE